MKTLTLIILSITVSLSTFAKGGEEIDRSSLVVTYDYVTLDTAYSMRPQRFTYVLQHGSRYDRFFDKRQYDKEHVAAGAEESLILPKELSVLTDRKKRTVETRNSVGKTNIMYSEEIPEMEWEIMEDSVKTVCGYRCKLATTRWRGRDWKAWFTPEINVSAGPWKFHGLPGMILRMDDSTGSLHWEATEVKLEELTMYSPKGDFTPVSREEYNATLYFYGTDLLGYLNSLGMETRVNGAHDSSKKIRTHYAPPELE